MDFGVPGRETLSGPRRRVINLTSAEVEEMSDLIDQLKSDAFSSRSLLREGTLSNFGDDPATPSRRAARTIRSPVGTGIAAGGG
jgi:hypothetical protein